MGENSRPVGKDRLFYELQGFFDAAAQFVEVIKRWNAGRSGNGIG